MNSIALRKKVWELGHLITINNFSKISRNFKRNDFYFLVIKISSYTILILTYNIISKKIKRVKKIKKVKKNRFRVKTLKLARLQFRKKNLTFSILGFVLADLMLGFVLGESILGIKYFLVIPRDKQIQLIYKTQLVSSILYLMAVVPNLNEKKRKLKQITSLIAVYAIFIYLNFASFPSKSFQKVKQINQSNDIIKIIPRKTIKFDSISANFTLQWKPKELNQNGNRIISYKAKPGQITFLRANGKTTLVFRFNKKKFTQKDINRIKNKLIQDEKKRELKEIDRKNNPPIQYFPKFIEKENLKEPQQSINLPENSKFRKIAINLNHLKLTFKFKE